MALDNRGKRALGVAAGAAVAAAILHLLGKRGFEPFPPTYICPYCGETFATYEELLAHIQAEHPTDPPSNFGHIVGTVKDIESGKAINNARVCLDGLKDTTTHSQGNFETSYVAYGTHYLRIEADNYMPIEKDIEVQTESALVEILMESLFSGDPDGWTPGVRVTAITVSPDPIYLGQEVHITVDFECAYPVPPIHAEVSVDGERIVGDFTPIHENISMLYTPTTAGTLTAKAQDCSATFVVLEDIPSTYYFPWGGTRIPVCMKIGIDNVPPFTCEAYCGEDTVYPFSNDEHIMFYEFLGGTLKIGGLNKKIATFWLPSSFGGTYWTVDGNCKLSTPSSIQNYIAEHIIEAIPTDWSPLNAIINEWKIYEVLDPGRKLDAVLVLPIQFSCQPYWDTKEELIEAAVADYCHCGVFHDGSPVTPGLKTDFGAPNCYYVCKGVHDMVKPISMGYSGAIQADYIDCPYCGKRLIFSTDSTERERVRSLLEHIEGSHPNHPLTEPAWF